MTTHSHTHTNCAQMLAQINAYADHELPAELCVELEAHLAECRNCRIVLDTLAKTIYLVRQLPDAAADLPADAEQRLFTVLDLGDFLTAAPGGSTPIGISS